MARYFDFVFGAVGCLQEAAKGHGGESEDRDHFLCIAAACQSTVAGEYSDTMDLHVALGASIAHSSVV